MATFVLDADDTLWMNEWQYSKAKADFLAFLYDRLGDRMPNITSVLTKYSSIDATLGKEMGVRRGRVARTMVETYLAICQWSEERFGKVAWNKGDEEAIRQIGDQPFDYTKLRWTAGAKEVLDTLKEAGHTLCLLSSYDSNVFPARADFMGIDKFFAPERIRTAELGKTREDFIAVSGWTPESEDIFVSVGNGEKDMRIPVEISENWRGVYVPYGSTSPTFSHSEQADFTPPPIEHPRIITVDSIYGVLGLLPLS